MQLVTYASLWWYTEPVWHNTQITVNANLLHLPRCTSHPTKISNKVHTVTA